MAKTDMLKTEQGHMLLRDYKDTVHIIPGELVTSHADEGCWAPYAFSVTQNRHIWTNQNSKLQICYSCNRRRVR